jgi:hypothetical protein
MKQKQFARYLVRDRYCLHCGDDQTLVPNHRANRGMGGSRVRDVPSNIITLCASMNSLIESDDRSASLARLHGWKLNSWDNPLLSPVYDTMTGLWYLLDDSYDRVVIDREFYEH